MCKKAKVSALVMANLRKDILSLLENDEQRAKLFAQTIRKPIAALVLQDLPKVDRELLLGRIYG